MIPMCLYICLGEGVSRPFPRNGRGAPTWDSGFWEWDRSPKATQCVELCNPGAVLAVLCLFV
jgi:hypothetical protein